MPSGHLRVLRTYDNRRAFPQLPRLSGARFGVQRFRALRFSALRRLPGEPPQLARRAALHPAGAAGFELTVEGLGMGLTERKAFERPHGTQPQFREQGQCGHLAGLGLGVVLAVGSFVGSTLFVDSRFAGVVHESHQVSDNAMPSIVELGTVRRELAYVHSILSATRASHPVVRSSTSASMAFASAATTTSPEAETSGRLWSSCVA
jgi:hypothetical protein